MNMMDIFKRKNKLKLIFVCLSCCGIGLVTLGFDTESSVQLQTTSVDGTYHRRHIRKPLSLYVVSNDSFTNNINHQSLVNGLDDVVYVKKTGSSSKSMIDFVKSVVENGASWLFLPSVQNKKHVNLAVKRFNFHPKTTSLVYTGPARENVDFHFIPESFRQPRDDKRVYKMAKYETPLLQTLFNTDPSKIKHVDYRAPPVAVPLTSLYPFSREDTLYSYKTFWALVPLEVSDVLWSYWVGRLLREINEVMVFYVPHPQIPSGFKSSENDHSEVRRMMDGWKCDSTVTFFTCVLDFTRFLQDNSVFTSKHVRLIDRWVQELLLSGYQEPTRRTHVPKITFLHDMSFWPAKPEVRKESYSEIFGGICSKTKPRCSDVPSSHKKRFDNILLILVYNKVGYYKVIDAMESLYRPHFSQILHCGQNFSDFTRTRRDLKHKDVSFIDVNFGNGQSGNQCIQRAIALKYDVDGYLHLGDDVMFNFWNLSPLPMDRFWFQKDMYVGKLSQNKVKDVWKDPDWWPWTTGHRGVRKLRFTFSYLQKQNDPKIRKFLKTLEVNSGGKERAFYQASDIHYVPSVLANDYTYFMDFFDRTVVYFEIAIPTVMNGLVKNKNIYRLPGTYLWHSDRSKYQKAYKTSEIFFHSMKLGQCLKDSGCSKFYCEKYLSCWDKV